MLSLDDRLPDLRIRLRPSMKKFESSHKELEITDHPTYRPAYLNRQMITLLQSLGTKTSALEKLEKNMTSKIDQLLDGVVNEKTLNQITWGHSKDILKEAIETFGLDDGFLRALVNKHSRKALKLLIKKTRILIPNSAYVMGVLDEYGCLEENEVFCQALSTYNLLERKIINFCTDFLASKFRNFKLTSLQLTMERKLASWEKCS